MKLRDLTPALNEHWRNDPTKGEDYKHERDVDVDCFSIDYVVKQSTMHTPAKYYPDSPPESRRFFGDVDSVRIDIITNTVNKFDIQDLDYEIKADLLNSKAEMKKFYDYLLAFGRNLDEADLREYEQSIVSVLKNDPTIVTKIFHEIYKDCKTIGEYKDTEL
jgi:hypothetical protein